MKLSALEIELGFQQIQAYDIYGHGQSEWTYIWARVLSDSDIVLRLAGDTSISYVHKRFGVTSTLPTATPEWHDIGHRWENDVRQAVTDAQFGADAVESRVRILPRKADLRIGGKP